MKEQEDDVNFGVKLVDETNQTPRVEPTRIHTEEIKDDSD